MFRSVSNHSNRLVTLRRSIAAILPRSTSSCFQKVFRSRSKYAEVLKLIRSVSGYFIQCNEVCRSMSKYVESFSHETLCNIMKCYIPSRNIPKHHLKYLVISRGVGSTGTSKYFEAQINFYRTFSMKFWYIWKSNNV